MEKYELADAYPALRKLGLSARALEVVAQRGYLCKEHRGDRCYSKLRFRIEGKQRVKYVGIQNLDAVAAELDSLRAGHKLHVAMRAKSLTIRRLVNEARTVLDAALRADGLYFHGTKLRA